MKSWAESGRWRTWKKSDVTTNIAHFILCFQLKKAEERSVGFGPRDVIKFEEEIG